MPKQGGQGKGKPKLGNRDLGKALLKKQLHGYLGLNGNKADKVDMRSILDNTPLDDFIITADMEDSEAEVRRVHQNDSFLVDSSSLKPVQNLSLDDFNFQHLVIPRKPAWSTEMTAEEVDYNEKKGFLQWRRNIAALECNNASAVKVTPFEKNIDVWRQLWRVVERSDIIVQIVDARNPLLYFTSDLMKYAAEQSPPRQMMLIINKSDFLSDLQRMQWAVYFDSIDLKHIFYSAKLEQKKLDENVDLSGNIDMSIMTVKDAFKTVDKAKIFSRLELIEYFQAVSEGSHVIARNKNKAKVCVGMVGYPNVGKSSVINTLLGVSKSSHGVVRVGISSTPGKTKHFQTLELSHTLMLCDCPGLVFPSFMNSTGEMICAGILPINQMRDYLEPASVIAERVPSNFLEAAYGMQIVRELDLNDDPDRPPTAHEILCSYCVLRGLITNGTGRWDEFRACKELLRDLTDGKILYVAPPPTLNSTEKQLWLQETEKTMGNRKDVAERMAKYLSKFEIVETLPEVHIPVSDLRRDHKRLKHWGKKK